LAVIAGAAYAGWKIVIDRTTPECTVQGEDASYGFDRDQVANAQTITEEAARLRLPHHAVTIGIAAALQESRLQNLESGDRDSVGIFQQRPSQGWGTPAQLRDPRYASDRFLRALVAIPGWDRMPVNDAAQRVQHSATPTAYAQWEAPARALARVLTGEVVGALTCRDGVPGPASASP